MIRRTSARSVKAECVRESDCEPSVLRPLMLDYASLWRNFSHDIIPPHFSNVTLNSNRKITMMTVDEESNLDVSRVDIEVDVNPNASTDSNDLSFTLTETMALRKNLSLTFEAAEVKVNTRTSLAQLGSVASDIEGFEKNSCDQETVVFEAPTLPPPTSMAVFLRVRPIPTEQESTIEILNSESEETMTAKLASTTENSPLPRTIRTHPPPSSNTSLFYRGERTTPVREFKFSGVFGPETNQATVYHWTVEPLLAGLVDHQQSALVFSYGITNAGKTHTVAGPENPKTEHAWGLIPRAVQDLLRLSKGKQLRMEISYYEIYNEQVYDLLAENKNDRHFVNQRPPLNISEISGIVRGLSKHVVTDLSTGLSLISMARKSRRSAGNRINADSSRSHGICQLSVKRNGSPSANLWIVDLAGSERSKRTGGLRLHEAAVINKSLMTLNRCLTALRHNQEGVSSGTIMVPYRDSKLTQLFGHHWTGPFGCRTVMIVNVNPSIADFDESQHVLGYAAVAKTVQIRAVVAACKAAGAVEYGYDGHRKQKAANTSMAQRVVNAIKKISPKRNVDNLKRKASGRHIEQNSLFAASNQDPATKKQRKGETATENVAPLDTVPLGVTDNEFTLKEMRALKAALSVAKAENSVLQQKIQELEEKLETVETDVRSEVADEMDEQMQAMREQYESIIDDLKSKVEDYSEHTKSARKLQISKAEEKVDELLAQVEECEDEMKRMREEHLTQLDDIARKYEEERKLRDKALEASQSQVHELLQRLDELLGPSLKQPSQPADAQGAVDQGHKVDLAGTGFYEIETEHHAGKDGGNYSSQSVNPSSKDPRSSQKSNHVANETHPIYDEKQNLPLLIGDMETDQHADTDIEGQDENQDEKKKLTKLTKSSKKRQQPSGRKPLRSINHNEAQSDESVSADGFEADKWLYPQKAAKRDPSTGMYQKPKGRRPKGVEEWDETKGAWRLSLM